jgi:hypothetical protein
MLSEQGERVSAAEGVAIASQLRELADRAEQNGQQLLHFVYAMAAESLTDNLANAAEMDGDDADE